MEGKIAKINMVKTKKESKEKDLKKTISQVLKLLEIEGDFELTFTATAKKANEEAEKEKEEEIEIVLNTKDSGIVIGYHGEVLEALQLILSLCISKKLGRFVRVSLEVGDYKKNRGEFLKTLALQTKERVLLDKKEFSLPNLKSWERRIVHLILQDDKEVKTESVGEGKERTLVVKQK